MPEDPTVRVITAATPAWTAARHICASAVYLLAAKDKGMMEVVSLTRQLLFYNVGNIDFSIFPEFQEKLLAKRRLLQATCGNRNL